jgi:hypothetical protein
MSARALFVVALVLGLGLALISPASAAFDVTWTTTPFTGTLVTVVPAGGQYVGCSYQTRDGRVVDLPPVAARSTVQFTIPTSAAAFRVSTWQRMGPGGMIQRVNDTGWLGRSDTGYAHWR